MNSNLRLIMYDNPWVEMTVNTVKNAEDFEYYRGYLEFYRLLH